jgi:hypothetical protein
VGERIHLWLPNSQLGVGFGQGRDIYVGMIADNWGWEDHLKVELEFSAYIHHPCQI